MPEHFNNPAEQLVIVNSEIAYKHLIKDVCIDGQEVSIRHIPGGQLTGG